VAAWNRAAGDQRDSGTRVEREGGADFDDDAAARAKATVGFDRLDAETVPRLTGRAQLR
jgi:hypothetical protein